MTGETILIGIGTLLICASIAAIFFLVAKKFGDQVSLDSLYCYIEKVAADETAKKIGIDTNLYDMKERLRQSKSFKEALQERMQEEYFKKEEGKQKKLE